MKDTKITRPSSFWFVLPQWVVTLLVEQKTPYHRRQFDILAINLHRTIIDKIGDDP